MADSLWKVWYAVLSLLLAIRVTNTLLLMKAGVKVIEAFPRKLIPTSVQQMYSVQKMYLRKGFTVPISHKTFLFLLLERYLRVSNCLKPGVRAPNINIFTFEKVNKKLLDFQKKGRPLVINFGSCS